MANEGLAVPVAFTTRAQERRVSPRAPLRLVVHFQCPQGLETGQSLDLSARGMLLQSPITIELETQLSLKFHPPAWSRPALVNGVVVRSGDGGRRFGIHFEHAGSEAEAELAEFVLRQLGQHRALPPPTTNRGSVVPPLDARSERLVPTARVPADDLVLPKSPPEGVKGDASSLNLRDVERFLAEYGSNIARGGMSIETATRPEVGEVIEVSVELPNSATPLRISGRVVARQTCAYRTEQNVRLKLLDQPALRILHDQARLIRGDTIRAGGELTWRRGST